MNTQNKHLISYDKEFIKVNDLKWMPWIGCNYPKSELLLLGESFYEDGEEWLDDKLATRDFVSNQGLCSFKPEFSKRPFFNVIEKTLLNQEKSNLIEREKFWTSTAFFNLVQRILPTRLDKDRPKTDDFDVGWKVALKVAEILRPKICIKLGIDGIGRLGHKMANDNQGWISDPKEFYKKPHIINICKNNYHLKIIFINHPTGSYGYNYRYWASIISQTVPELDTLLR